MSGFFPVHTRLGRIERRIALSNERASKAASLKFREAERDRLKAINAELVAALKVAACRLHEIADKAKNQDGPMAAVYHQDALRADATIAKASGET